MSVNDCSTAPQDLIALSFSEAQNRSLNRTPSSPSPHAPPAYGLSCLSMSLGVLSNLTGLAVLAGSYSRFRRRSKAPFVLLAGALLLSDLVGQVIPGAFALYLHLEQRRRPPRVPGQRFEPPPAFCRLFGACMVFFGLCPLLLGGAMAVERCVGITRPFLHATLATVTHVRLAVLLLVTLALSLAALPALGLGAYVPQYPGTWCFLAVHGRLSPAHASLALVFSGLGLAALLLSVLCNSVSGATLLRARHAASTAATQKHRGPASTSSSTGRSLDLEMMTQLVVINVVSCVCWCPFLICISLSVGEFLIGSPPPHLDQKHERRLLLSLHLASWNQILDPWVYILLRRAVWRRCLGQNHKLPLTLNSSTTGSHRQDVFSLRDYTKT